MTMKLSNNGANFIASHEGGFKLAWYKLNDGVMTVGAGHTISLSEAKKKGISVGTKITKTQAIKWFEEDCAGFVNGTNRLLQQFGFKVNQNQFDALVSYAYNRGLGSATYDNGLYQLLHHSKSVSAISNNFLVYWGTNTTYKKGLLNRRTAEKKLFDTPVTTKTSSSATSKSSSTTNYKYTKNRNTVSLIDFMASNGLNSSFTNRTSLAKKYGISNYKGTSGQNTTLLSKLKAVKVTSSSAQYYTSNPGKVKLRTTCNLYKSVEFTDKNKTGMHYPKNTIFTITGVKKSKAGTPRLQTKSGYYLSANKKYVKKV